MKRKIETILSPPAPRMVGDGFRVHNFFPGGYGLGLKRMSPFFLMDYNSKIEFSPSEHQRGVGVHPHRGFETVTIAYHGKIAHHDSAGHSGVIGEGEVQWMTAASGVLHKEYHEKEFSRRGGTFQMVQLWVNLPAKYKMSAPKYQTITQEAMEKFSLPDGLGEVRVIAGAWDGRSAPATTFSPMTVANFFLRQGAKSLFQLPDSWNTGILMIDGEIKVNGESVTTDHFILFKNEGTDIELEASVDAVALLLSGEPINEPIAAHGPFLMNTQDELMQAYEDFNHGKFGQLED